MSKIRILIADDHAILRAGLRMLLGIQRDMEVVGEASDAKEALRMTARTAPDVLLMDISMPGPRIGDAIGQILKRCPGTRILVLTMHDDPAYLRAAMAAGASGYVVKKAADSELLSALRAVHRGRTVVDLTRRSAAWAPAGAAGGGATQSRLSGRELQVLRLLAQGHTNQKIADGIGVSVKTVETYRTRLGEKLGLRGRAELYRYAAEAGLLSPESGEER